MDDNTVALILGIVSSIASVVAVYFAKRGSDTAHDIKTNGVTHIVAAITPQAPLLPIRTIVVDGVVYQALPNVEPPVVGK